MQNSDSITICPVCHLGRLGRKSVTFLSVLDGTLISAPNTQVWECDVCHERQIDSGTISRIDTLIGPGGPPPNKYQPLRRYQFVPTGDEIPQPEKGRQKRTRG